MKAWYAKSHCDLITDTHPLEATEIERLPDNQLRMAKPLNSKKN
jgi:hypothetical protein